MVPDHKEIFVDFAKSKAFVKPHCAFVFRINAEILTLKTRIKPIERRFQQALAETRTLMVRQNIKTL